MARPPKRTLPPVPPPPPGDAYLRLINRINSVILSGGELETVLGRVVDVISEVLEVERVSIMLADSLTGHLHIRAAKGISREVWPTISIAPGQGIAGRVAQEGLPLMSRDIGKTGLPAKGGERYRDNSFACVPLIIHERILGVLSINNRSDGAPLDEAEFQLAMAVAALVSLAVENANLLSSAVTLQQHFRDVLSQMMHGVICTDRSASVTLCNPAAARLIGIAPDQAVGRALHTVLPGELRAAIKPLVAECQARGPHGRREIEVSAPGRSGTVPVDVTLTTLCDAGGDVDALVLVLEDLSLRREVAELRRLDELKSNFLAMVSHELRTPLTSIKGAVHLLASGTFEESADQRRAMYELLRKNTERLILQINNILDVNQLEHGNLNLFPRRLDLAGLLRRVQRQLEGEFVEKGVTLQGQLPERFDIVGDHERLTSTFMHLLDNALKFTPAGGHVTLWLAPGDETVEVHVRDTGVGLEAQHFDKVFAKFYQLEHTLTRQAGGNGLGLFIAKGVIELHGGTIAFQPVDGPGAEVVVRLPRGAPREAPSPTLTQEVVDV